MSDRLAELLKLASNDSGDTSDDKPPGVRVGDILSNGWASNRNPLKLFMYLGMSHDSFRGINIDGKSAGPVRKGNAVKIVLPRDTPDYWRTWELLAKQLPLLCLAVLCLSGCLTAAKIGGTDYAVIFSTAQTIFDGAQWMRDEDPADPFAEPPPTWLPFSPLRTVRSAASRGKVGRSREAIWTSSQTENAL